MNKVVFVFACVALLQIVSALECFSCSGPTCETEAKTWDKKTCGTSGVAPPANHQYACLKLSYKDKNTQKKVVERKCVITPVKDGKTNYNCQSQNVVGDQVECPVCQTDLCNSGNSIGFSFVTLSGVVLAIMASKLL